MAAKKKKNQRPSLVKFSFISIFWLVLVLGGMGKYWGLYGQMGNNHVQLVLYSLLPMQKQELAKALNFHYQNTFVRKYTKGLVLSCEPNVASITKQFNWFYRNSISSQFNELPDYHTLVKATLDDLNGGATVPIKNPSTYELESSLIHYSQLYDDGQYTEKDGRSNFLAQLGLGVKYTLATILPEASLAISAVGTVHDMLPDPEKLVPGVHCLQRLRLTNWFYSAGLLWLLIMMLYLRSIFATKKA